MLERHRVPLLLRSLFAPNGGLPTPAAAFLPQRPGTLSPRAPRAPRGPAPGDSDHLPAHSSPWGLSSPACSKRVEQIQRHLLHACNNSNTVFSAIKLPFPGAAVRFSHAGEGHPVAAISESLLFFPSSLLAIHSQAPAEFGCWRVHRRRQPLPELFHGIAFLQRFVCVDRRYLQLNTKKGPGPMNRLASPNIYRHPVSKATRGISPCVFCSTEKFPKFDQGCGRAPRRPVRSNHVWILGTMLQGPNLYGSAVFCICMWDMPLECTK